MFESSQETQLSSMMRSHGAAFTGDVITRFHALAGGRQSHGGEYNVKTVALGEQLAAISFDSILFVIDMSTLQTAVELVSESQSPILQLQWAPHSSIQIPASGDRPGLVRLASVDSEGKLSVWNVQNGELLTSCDLSNGVKSGYQGAVVDLAWGTASPDVLVALILPATLRFVNATTGAVMRTYSLAQGAVMAGICANRYDHSCFALTSAAGSLVVATVKDPNGTVEAQEVSLRETGAGVAKAQFVPNRGILLLLYMDCVVVYDRDLGTVLERIPLPRRFRAFKKWLLVEGRGQCLGCEEESTLSTFVIEHEGGAVSVWHDPKQEMKHTLYAYHELQPPMHSDAFGVRAAVLDLIPAIPATQKQLDAKSGSRSAVLVSVMMHGQFWKWSLPMPDLPTEVVPTQKKQLSRDFSSIYARSYRRMTSASINLVNLSSKEHTPNQSQALTCDDPPSLPTGHLPTLPEAGIACTSHPTRISTPPLLSPPKSPEASAFTRTLPVEEALSWSLDDVTQALGQESSLDITAPTTPLESTGQLQHGTSSMAAAAAAALAAVETDESAPGAKRQAELLMVQAGMPSNATVLAIFPVLLPTGSVSVVPRMPPATGARGHNSDGEEQDWVTIVPPSEGANTGPSEDAVSLIAAGTALGTVEVISVAKGACWPLAMTVVQSVKVANSSITSLQWLGPTLRFAAVSIENVQEKAGAAPSYRASVTVTDLASHSTQTLLSDIWKQEPCLVLRACPLGRFLLVIPTEGATQVWSIPIRSPPVRVRMLPLQFTALAWVLPPNMGFGEGSIFSAACEAPAASPVPDDIPASPSAKPASPEDPGAAKSLKPAATPREGEPHSAFVFAVRDGRLGSITVSDRGAAKRVVAPPRWSLQFVDQLSATGMAATGSLVFLGDDSGVLYQWATDTGETRVVPVGKKSIRTVLLAPPASPHLTPEPPPGAAQGRMLLVFGDGTYALWELDIELKAAAGGIRSSTQSSIGLIAEAAWLPLPPPLGRGNVATFLLKKGSIALVDVAQRPEVRATRRARSEALRQLLNASDKSTAHQTTLLDIGQEDGFEIDERARDRTAHSKRDGGPAVHLADGPKCASALCLAPARLALLQLILQAATPPSILRDICRSDHVEALRGAHALLCHLLSVSDAVAAGTRPRLAEPDQSSSSTLSKEFNNNLVKQPSGLGYIKSEQEDIELLRSFKLDRLVTVLKEIAHQRTGARNDLLLATEYTFLEEALEQAEPTLRMCNCMALAAQIGDSAQTHFWRHLPATLAAHAARRAEGDGFSGGDEGDKTGLQEQGMLRRASALRKGAPLHSNESILLEAAQRMAWHESAHGGSFGTGEFEALDEGGEVAMVYDRRILECVCIGDYEMAVGLAMATPPERTMAFYRNSLVTIAAASATRFQRDRVTAPTPDGNTLGLGTTTLRGKAPTESDQFALQALKVVAEHARSVGDIVTGVVLLCSAGRFQEAIGQLQAGNDWPRAITLAAHTLAVPDRNALLHAWAMLLLRNSASTDNMWHIVGLLSAAGSFRSAAAAMRDASAIMHCSVLAQACVRLGLTERVSSAREGADDADTDTKCSVVTASASLKGNSGTVFVEPPSVRRERSSLNADDLLPLPGVLQTTYSDSECAEAGSDVAGSPSRLDCLPTPDLAPHRPQKALIIPSDASVVPLGHTDAGKDEGATKEDVVELEVLANLHAPAAVVQAKGVQATASLGRVASNELTGSGALPTVHSLGAAMEVITELDDLTSIHAAVRRHAIDVLSEAMASEAWM